MIMAPSVDCRLSVSPALAWALAGANPGPCNHRPAAGFLRLTGQGFPPNGTIPKREAPRFQKEAALATNDRGTKREDPETGKKFYDLNKDPIVSPYTGKSYPRSYFEQNAPTARRPAAEPEEEEEEVEVEETVEPGAPEIVSLEEADAEEAGEEGEEIPDVEDVEDVEDIGDDDSDAFLEDDEEDEEDLDFDVGGGEER
jgi:uncharacterized protein (TIGR02300 family)